MMSCLVRLLFFFFSTSFFTNALLTPLLKPLQLISSPSPSLFSHSAFKVSEESTATAIYHGPEFSWKNSNVYNISSFPSISCDNGNNPWQDLVPSPWNLNSKGCDVTIEFDDSHDGAHRLVAACYAAVGYTKQVSPSKLLFSQLEKAMDAFRGVTQELLMEEGTSFTPKHNPGITCKARIVATRGQTGTKCPRWHSDHVPFRYIQSLVGPGCEYVVGETGLRRDALNDLDVVDEMSVEELNELMVDTSRADIRQAPEGQAVLLMGKAWAERQQQQPQRHISSNQNTNVDHTKIPPLMACVHKSPELKPWEGRVLLTMDIVQEDLE